MKKIKILTVALVMGLIFVGCGTASTTNSETPDFNTQSTIANETLAESEPESEAESEPECIHDWQDATYQEPRICTICKETEGDPITPSLEISGLFQNVETSGTYEYKTICNSDPEDKAIGQVTISDFEIVSSNEWLEEAMNGYEWRTAVIRVEYSTQYSGMMTRLVTCDYYTGDEYESDIQISYNGENYTITETAIGWKEETTDDVFSIEKTYACQVPVGYDGVALVLYNAANAPSENGYSISGTDLSSVVDIADENTLLFRMTK